MSKPQEVVALIPVREGSERIRDKNFSPFGKHPTLVHRKIAHLRQAGCFAHIYLSSDSPRVAKIAEECDVEFLPRDPYMCTSKPRWDEVVVSILETVPGNPHVGWAMATSPLFENYKSAVETYLKNLGLNDSLVCVKKMREYLMDGKGRPLFTGFGIWHPYTSEMEPLYAISDTFFIAKKSDQLLWRYWFGRTPHLFENSPIESVDVNFQEDLELAQAFALYLERKQS